MVMACVTTEEISLWCVLLRQDQFGGRNVYQRVALLPLLSTNSDPILQQLPLYQLV